MKHLKRVLHWYIHVRNPDETSSSNPDLFQAVQEGVVRHCPGMIVQFSTGGRGRDATARGSSLFLKPDMASLSTGSVNFPNIVYENDASLVNMLASSMRNYGIAPEIEIFDLSHLHGARRLIDEGLMDDHPHIQFVLGIKNAMPAEEHLLDILLAEKERILPHATWNAAGIGRFQLPVMNWALSRGADGVRTGMEDNIRITQHQLASSNAELVRMARDALAAHGRYPASPDEARKILHLQQTV